MSEIRVLVADAQYMFANALAVALSHHANLSLVDEYPTTGVETISAVTTHNVQVVLVDYWLHEMDGPAVTKAILARRPQTKIVTLSWFHGPQQIETALNAGAVGFLPKSLSVEKAAEGIRRATDGEDPIFAEELEKLVGRILERRDYIEGTVRGLAQLTNRELELLRLLAAGLTVHDSARRLDITLATVRSHVHNMLQKTEAQTQLELVAIARQEGLVP